MSKLKNLIDKRFGRLLVAARADNDKRNRSRWHCLCDCGTQTTVASRELLSGDTKSCGCLQREMIANRARTHGMSQSVEYGTWIGMRDRCSNSKAAFYPRYGGRGIKVCPEWIDDFPQFFKDMGPRPEDCACIDRRDNDGNYEPGNCRWTTWDVQAMNRGIKSTNKSGITGVHQHSDGGWIARISIDKIDTYLGYFTDKEAAIIARQAAEIELNNED